MSRPTLARVSPPFCRISACALLVAFVACPLQGYAQHQVPRWSVYEINLTASGSTANWYTDLKGGVIASFKGPGGVTERASGFWDDGRSFKIRFTPTTEGVWTYETTSSNPGLNGKSGKFTCVAPGLKEHGFLRVDADHPHSFVWDDGTRYFMWGQTYYDVIISALANDNWKESVDRSLAYGMNKIRMHVYAQSFYTPGVEFNGYPDAQPYLGASTSPDRDRLNIPYWRKLDEMVRYMGSKGMVADLIVTNPYWDNREFGTDEQNDRFVSYLVARYAAYPNITWCLANEWNSSATEYKGAYRQRKADFDRMGGVLSATDPWRAYGKFLRPFSIHNSSESEGFEFFDSSWPTFVDTQRHNSNAVRIINGDEWGNSGITYNFDLEKKLGRDMPVVNDEYGYIGQKHPPLAPGVVMTRAMLRGAIWGIAVAGGYGSSGDIRLHPDGKGNPEITGDWLDAPEEYGDIRRMIDFFTTKGIRYWKMSGQNDLLTAGTRAYVLAETGHQYVIYSATGGSVSLNLAEGTYAAWRYDPTDGTETGLGTVTGGGVQTFSLPASHDEVVLLLRKQ